ncbi:DUF2931 family protein [Flavobacterium humidisoli]|uniref:DUF2931 family protein n=1 Tax=Flavobacterium humidisoli TaxID=2937442 RepID=A0ABY4LSX1_9FLAO|nr:DUF2931 family protein [Flavobacterium humidisoli]UPZ15418.1 DUF2931 family protein [Flavobacterium humidisoli]
MYPKVRFFLYCFLIIGLFCSCQPKDTFSWNAGLSGPKNYPSGAPFVEYFYQGKSIAGASSGTGADQGWGITSGGYVGGDRYKPVPDSMAVKWVCSVDNLVYKGGFKLPRDKMLELFKRKVIDSYGNQNDYSVIVAGMAPGGNITLWMQGGYATTEIAKFKILKGEEDQNIDDDYKKKDIKSWGNYLAYWKIHGIPYSVWEKGEKEYPYDIGFSSKDFTYGYHLTFITKEGSWFSLDKLNSFIPWEKNEIQTKKAIEKKHKSPVQLNIQWYTDEENYKERQWYDGKIVLPQNFEDFLKTRLYSRLLISIEKDEHKDAVYGKLLLKGRNQEKEIMIFKLGKYDYKLEKQLSPEYVLPKDFVFPKWEGREPIEFPELDYWQEK